jgi:hypothetical protein
MSPGNSWTDGEPDDDSLDVLKRQYLAEGKDFDAYFSGLSESQQKAVRYACKYYLAPAQSERDDPTMDGLSMIDRMKILHDVVESHDRDESITLLEVIAARAEENELVQAHWIFAAQTCRDFGLISRDYAACIITHAAMAIADVQAQRERRGQELFAELISQMGERPAARKSLNALQKWSAHRVAVLEDVLRGLSEEDLADDLIRDSVAFAQAHQLRSQLLTGQHSIALAISLSRVIMLASSSPDDELDMDLDEEPYDDEADPDWDAEDEG